MGDLGAEPRLVVPEGLVIDDCVRERLARRLAAAPASAAGVAALTGDLPPGASYRVHAEWRSLEAHPAPSRAESAVAGAVLLRPGVGYAVRDRVVEIAPGSALVDEGATVHDPYRPIGALQVAWEAGRPPFPYRPVVVLLSCESEGHADWARRLANRLLRRNVEARIAVPEVVEGMHLTRPCLPCEATIRALAPDVVVTLDDAAAARVDAWCAGDRSTVVIALDAGLSADVELVSWQIGRAAGRLRARIGPRVDAPALAALVGRLCAGPHPMPPSDRPELLDVRTPVREQWTTGAAAKASCVVITGALAAPVEARVLGLLDNLEAASVAVTRAQLKGGVIPGAVLPVARSAEVVLLVGVELTPGVRGLIDERRAGGLATAVDLGADALAPAGARAAAPLLTEPAAALAGACGLVVSPAGAAHTAARDLGVRALVLPSLLTRGRVAALREARARFDPAAPLVLGWNVGAGGAPRAWYTNVVAEVVAKILADRSDVRVELVGDSARAPISRRGDSRVSMVADSGLEPAAMARWTGHLWTPALIAGEVADDALVLEAAGCAGVPTVLPEAARRVIDGFVSPHLLVKPPDSADDWARALRHLFGNAERRATRAEEACRRAGAINSLATATTVVNRFVGWARYNSSRDGSSRDGSGHDRVRV